MEYSDLFAIIFVPTLIFGIYFLPAIVAFIRNKHNKVAILVANLLLGWTGFGWIAVMVWAAMKD